MRSVVKAISGLPLVFCILVLMAVPPAAAQVAAPITVTGKSARASLELPGGYAVEVTVTFEEVIGLHPRALDISATVVDPTDPELLARLPGAGSLAPSTDPLDPVLAVQAASVSIPTAFPVLVRIEPTSTSALTFAGVVSVSLYTHNLQLDRAAPMGLYKSHDGGPFWDIMGSEGRGSYRAGGSGGDFSEFLILVDTRPIDTVIAEKFAAVDAEMVDHEASIPRAVAEVLRQHLVQAWSFYEAGATRQAMAEIRAFSRKVVAHSGEEIPDVWRANCNGTNVAGRLRSAADTLRFSLDRKASH